MGQSLSRWAEDGWAGAGAACCSATSTRVPTGTWWGGGLRQGSTNGPLKHPGKDVTRDSCNVPQALLRMEEGGALPALSALPSLCTGSQLPVWKQQQLFAQPSSSQAEGTPAPQGWHCCREEHGIARCTSQQPSTQTHNGRRTDDVQKGSSLPCRPGFLPAAGLWQHTGPLLSVRASGAPGWPLPALGAGVIPRWSHKAPRATGTMQLGFQLMLLPLVLVQRAEWGSSLWKAHTHTPPPSAHLTRGHAMLARANRAVRKYTRGPAAFPSGGCSQPQPPGYLLFLPS